MNQFIARHANCMQKKIATLFCAWLMFFPLTAKGAWFDIAWPFRRPIDVTWDADHADGNELASAEFYTDGHSLPKATDLRVATEDGKLVATHILMAGPGDRIRIVFCLQRGIKKYYAYFGNQNPPEPAENLQDVKFQSGLMIETKVWSPGPVNDFAHVEESWDRSGPSLGQAMIPSAFLGYNIFGDEPRWISKIVGSFFAPLDGQYILAMSVDDEGAMYIDGQPLLFAHIGPADVRNNVTIYLMRGRHDFLLYHVNVGGDGRFTVAWRKPNSGQFEVMGRGAFGTCFGSVVGAMEEHDKPLVADFSVANVGECFFADHYSLRYHFISNAKPISPATYTWDFGDGQTAAATQLDHVFLTDGVYPVRLTVRVGANSQSQMSRIVVSRNYQNLQNPDEDDPKVISSMVEDYELRAMAPGSLARSILLHLRSGRVDVALAVANELTQRKKTDNPGNAADALGALDRQLVDDNRAELASAIWERVPIDGDLQPHAARRAAQLAIWWKGDFAKAVRLVEPFKANADPSVRRLYAQALILDGQIDVGKKILLDLPNQGPENRQAALSGASARSVEFFIRDGDAESGEEAWERWQARYPTDFLEGYSVMLRTKLIELRKNPLAAAKVAEAFAIAVPGSSYAPQLLDRASKLLAADDPVKSRALRELLRQKYPEDPLSQ